MDDQDLDALSALLDDELSEDVTPVQPSNSPPSVGPEQSVNDIEDELKKMEERMNRLKQELLNKKSPSGMSSPADNSPEAVSTSKGPTRAKIKSVDVDLFSTNIQSVPNAKTTVKEPSVVHDGDTDSSDDEEKRYPTQGGLTSTGKAVKNILRSKPRSFSASTSRPAPSWSSRSIRSEASKADAAGVRDPYSGIRIIKPLVSSDLMEARMSGRKMVKMSLLDGFVRNKITEDWVTIGVVVHKSPPKTSKTGNTFSIWKMTDLVDCDNLVSVFLFGDVHQQHWKTAVGSVVGILNPSVMPNRDSFGSRSEVCLSIDHPGKVMPMGTSRDFGICKGASRSGQPCTNIVNTSTCPYCIYHVKAEYRKMSSKRTELQASFSGVTPNGIRQKVLRKSQVMYGGQLFMNPLPPVSRAHKEKDKFTLSSLKVAQKAAEIERNARATTSLLHLSSEENKALSNVASKSDFLGRALCSPSAGSRNFLKHIVGEDTTQQTGSKKGSVVSVTAKDLLKMHKEKMKSLGQHAAKVQHKLPPPVLGRGFESGGIVRLGDLPGSKAAATSLDVARLKALGAIKRKGPLAAQDPNAVKKNMKAAEVQERLQKRLERSFEKEGNEEDKPPEVKRSRLDGTEVSDEMIEKLLAKKSSHAHELEDLELEEQVRYFKVLERKEQLEEKMASVREMVCEVVSCSKCQYVAHQASELCKNESHPLKHHKAVKRFFKCKDCNHRTYAFTKIPTRSCRNCNGSNFERTSMLKPKDGPKMDHEKLLIRGEERKFINS